MVGHDKKYVRAPKPTPKSSKTIIKNIYKNSDVKTETFELEKLGVGMWGVTGSNLCLTCKTSLCDQCQTTKIV